ncbi:MAG TPA: hypothetical protein VJV39_03490 [Dongiaceae bacterium]|nr:hypothetical protein [Dongiaceae bacterium]
MRWLCALAIPLALSGCEASQPDRGLEARASDGDVSAACDLVLQDLQQCAASRKDWISKPGSPRPACLDDPVPAGHQRYFSQAIDALAGSPERRDLLTIISDGAASTAASLKLGVGAPERFDSSIDLIAQSCVTLRG